MQSAPLVTIIVPTYNYGHFITDTLESVIAQTYPNWECIVVDDGSTDDTAQRVAAYLRQDPRIRYVYQEHRGVSAARNTGLSDSSGLYVQLLDADDLIEARKIELQVDYLERNRQVHIVYGDVRYFETGRFHDNIYSTWGSKEDWMPRVSGSGKAVLLPLFARNIMAINCALVRRGVFDAVGPFDDKLISFEDWDYWIRCAAGGMRFQYQHDEGAFALVRHHPTSLSKDRGWTMRGVALMLRKDYSSGQDAAVVRAHRAMQAQFTEWLAVYGISRGQRFGGARRLVASVIMGGNLKARLKRLTYAVLSVLLPGRWFEAITRFSFSGYLRHKFRGLRS